MPRRVEDIVPVGRRSVRDIPLDIKEGKKNTPPRDTTNDAARNAEIRIRKVPIAPPLKEVPIDVPEQSSRGRGRIIVYGCIVLVILGALGYAASIYFARAVFTIVPREVPIAVDNVYTARYLNRGASPLAYNLIERSFSASTTVPATRGERVETKAQGTVTLFNSYTSQPWQLIAGTRLQSKDGKIYRLAHSVVIPKLTKSNGEIVPGKITAKVVADKAGREYNLEGKGGERLSIVAYADSSKYSTIYAERTTDIQGGFVGERNVVSPALLASTTAGLKENIRTHLRGEIKKSLSTESFMYDQGFIEIFGDPEIQSQGDTMAVVSLRGSFYGIAFDRDELVGVLVGSSTVRSFGGMAFEPAGLDKLTFTISNVKDFSPIKKDVLALKFKGTMKLIGVVPVDMLKERFAGISLAETTPIMQSLASVIDLEQSSGQVVPPWSKIPQHKDKISILVKP